MPLPQPLGEGGYGAAQHRLLAPGALIELIQQAQPQLFEFTVAACGVVVLGAALGWSHVAQRNRCWCIRYTSLY